MPADLLVEPAEAPPFVIARVSVDQYHRMIESGVFTEDDRIELLEGWVVQKMPKSPEHEFAVGELEEQLRQQAPAEWLVRNQAPITLDDSEPEPDLSIARGSRKDFIDHHPTPDDLALVIEVADTTLATDRRKARTYGAAQIPVYWLVNLRDETLEVYWEPDTATGFGYRQRQVLSGESEVQLDVPLCTVRPRTLWEA